MTDYRKDYKPNARWSEEHKSYQHDSYTRFFANVVRDGYQFEDNEKNREKRLETFHNQRKRGTTQRPGDQSQIQTKGPDNQVNLKQIRGLTQAPNLREQSVSHYSKSILHENVSKLNMYANIAALEQLYEHGQEELSQHSRQGSG